MNVEWRVKIELTIQNRSGAYSWDDTQAIELTASAELFSVPVVSRAIARAITRLLATRLELVGEPTEGTEPEEEEG